MDVKRVEKPKRIDAASVGTPKPAVDLKPSTANYVEVVSADGEGSKTTLWIAKDSRKVVKMSALLPQVNGATLTSELTQ